MYSVSEAYSEAITKPSRRWRLGGNIRLQDGTSIDINDSMVLGQPMLESQMMNGTASEDQIDIGAVFAAKLTMTIRSENTAYSFSDARVRLVVGLQIADGAYEDIPMGIFYIHSPSIKRVKDTISFNAYDKMIFLPFELTDDMRKTISGMTPYGATGYLCSLAGIQLAQDKDTVEAFPNGEITIDASDKRIETARDLIMWCAHMMACFARFDRSGKLEYVQIKAENDEATGMIIPVREISASQRFDTFFADGVLRITSLSMLNAEGKLAWATFNATNSTKRSIELELKQNPLLINQSVKTIPNALKDMLTVLKTAYFRPFNTTIANDPALDAGDYVRLLDGAIDTTRKYATGIITHSTWRYGGRQELVNVGEVPVVSQLESDISTASEDGSLATVTPKSQLEKRVSALEASLSSSGSGTSVSALTTYSQSDAVTAVCNGITYTVEKDETTGLISKITDSLGNAIKPELDAALTDVASANTLFWAVAMARGIGISTLKPVIELLFNDGLENTGSGDYAIAPSENSDEIVYADGLNGKCYAATNHSQIVISDVAELLQNDYTIVFWTKIEDTGLDPYPQWRRITWWQVNGVYRGLELTYSSSTSTNAPYFVVDGNKNGLSTDSVINDGNWHSVSIVQRGGNITTTIDGIEQIIANNCVLMPASTELSLSSKNYSLNGYISSFRVYDRALSYAQIDQVLGLH